MKVHRAAALPLAASSRMCPRLGGLAGSGRLVVLALLLLAAACDSPTEFAQAAPAPQLDVSPGLVDLWWPTEGAWVSGAQLFKARLTDRVLSTYKMTWRVDGGQKNNMVDSNVDAPHKEANVNVTSWTWKGTGPYVLTFTATDSKTKKVIAERSVSIRVGTAPAPPAPVASVVVSPATPSITIGETLQLQATLLDAAGNVLTGRSVTWTSSNPTVATTNATGLVSAATEGTVMITAESEGRSGLASVTISAPPAPLPSGNPFDAIAYFVDPTSNARLTANQWQTTRPADAFHMEKIAQNPQADWFGGWSGDITTAVANRTTTITNAGALPVFVTYNIPGRDCGGYSAGGSATADAYRTWIHGFANGIGDRRAVVILEPDALAAMDCLPLIDQDSRVQLLAEAVQTFKAKPNVAVYIDAGHPRWKSPSTIASRLTRAGVASADGFSLNISNFIADDENIAYGQQVSDLLGGKHFTIDSSRNGLGPTSDSQWCNPSGRALGKRPTAATGHPLVDAFYWIKRPGESDGSCNGGPSAGSWWTDYALGLGQRTTWDVVVAFVSKVLGLGLA